MKKIVLSLAVLFSAAMTVSCSSNGGSESGSGDKASANSSEGTAELDFTSVTNTLNPAVEGTMNIRYYQADSVLNNFQMVKDLSDELNKKLQTCQQRIKQLENQLQTKGTNIETKMNNQTYLSQESYEADVKDFQTAQQKAQNEVAQLQQEMAEAEMTVQIRVNEALSKFVDKYAQENGFQMVLGTPLPYPAYFDPALDVTTDIIKGLNDSYSAPAK